MYTNSTRRASHTVYTVQSAQSIIISGAMNAHSRDRKKNWTYMYVVPDMKCVYF